MVDVPTAGTSCAEMPVFERLRKLRERWERLRTGTFADSSVRYLWQQWPKVAGMPTDGWEASLAFGSEIAYVVVKPPQKEIGVTAPPVLVQNQGSGKGEDGGMRHWSVSLEAFPVGDVAAASVDIAQGLLLVVQPVETCW